MNPQRRKRLKAIRASITALSAELASIGRDELNAARAIGADYRRAAPMRESVRAIFQAQALLYACGQAIERVATTLTGRV